MLLALATRTFLLLPWLLLHSTTALTLSPPRSNCILVASTSINGMVPCFTSRHSTAALPNCLITNKKKTTATATTTTDEEQLDAAIITELTRRDLESFLHIGRARRRELVDYVERRTTVPSSLPVSTSLIKIVLDGSCSNNVELKEHGWLVVGRNILNLFDVTDFHALARIDVLVIYEHYWNELTEVMKKNIVTLLGRIMSGGGGGGSDRWYASEKGQEKEEKSRQYSPRQGGRGRVVIVGFGEEQQQQADSSSTTSSSTTLSFFQDHSFYSDVRQVDLEKVKPSAAELYLGIFPKEKISGVRQTHQSFLPTLHIVSATVRNQPKPKEENEENNSHTTTELFFPPPQTNTRPSSSSSPSSLSQQLVGITKTVVVNLDTRPDRWQQTSSMLTNQLNLVPDFDYERRSAFNGQRLGQMKEEEESGKDKDAVNEQGGMSPDLSHLFRTSTPSTKSTINPYQDHGYRTGVLGCSISHLMIWREMASNPTLEMDDAWLILEDDVTITSPHTTLSSLNLALLSAWGDSAWNWIYVTSLEDTATKTTLYDNHEISPGMYQYRSSSSSSSSSSGNGNVRDRSYGGGTGGYLLRKKGAVLLLQQARKYGIAQPIDWFMIEVGLGSMTWRGESKSSNVMNRIYVMTPYLFNTPKGLGERGTVSDTTEMYPAQQKIAQAQKIVEDRDIVMRCGSKNSSSDGVITSSSSSSSSLPGQQQQQRNWFTVDVSHGGDVVPATATSWIVPRPSFDLTVELDMLQQCPISVSDLIDGTYQCSRVCVEMTQANGLSTETNENNNVQLEQADTNITTTWCRNVRQAGRTLRIPAPKLGMIQVRMWMEDEQSRKMSIPTKHMFQVHDIAIVRLLASQDQSGLEIALHVPAERWTFHSDLYVMCGEVKLFDHHPVVLQENNNMKRTKKMKTIALGCRELSSTWSEEGGGGGGSNHLLSQYSGTGMLRIYLMGIDGRAFGHSEYVAIE